METRGGVRADSENEKSCGGEEIERQPKDNSAETPERKCSHGQEFQAETGKNR